MAPLLFDAGMRARVRPVTAEPALRPTVPSPMLPWAALAFALALPQPAAQPDPPQPVPPALRLGLRVLALQNSARVIPTVVLVSDPESYLEAISAWRPDRRFPVLIDDQTARSREDIARFVRGFGATRVVRWSSPGAHAGNWNTVTREALAAAVARSWTLPAEHANQDNLMASWKHNQFAPPGIVVLDPADPAWTAGVALAAARGQILAFAQADQGVDRIMSPPQADQLATTTQDIAEASGWAWKSLGDDLDAVTLCLNAPNRVDKGNAEFYALTDRLGRPSAGGEGTARWAWAGQVFGTASESAYRAMCSLFLQPRSAWLFDGYPDEKPWNFFDATKAGEVLRGFKFDVETLDTPRTGARDWRARAARPVDASLILVNTKGNDDFFELTPGRCTPADVPLLARPALLHMVHSWAFTNAGNRERLGARWLERGVFLAAGSVQEPYLQAFVPTPVVAGRLGSGGVFGAAVRTDDAPLWKIGVYGDPLFTIGREAPRTDEDLPLAGWTDLVSGLRADLKGERYGNAITTLELAGRDADAAKLAEGLLAAEPAQLPPDAGEVGVFVLARAGRNDLVGRAFAVMPPDRQADPALRDVLWLTAHPLLEGDASPDLLRILEKNLRTDNASRDALSLAACVHRRGGRDAALRLIDRAIDATPDPKSKDELRRAKDAPWESWGR